MIYLIHFDEKIAHAQHYIGCCKNLKKRVASHANGDGAKLLKVANDRAIGWRVARVWLAAGFQEERLIKTFKNSPRYCPICNLEPATFQGIADFPMALIDFPVYSKELICHIS